MIKECPDCKGTKFKNNGKEVLCTKCGLVIEENNYC